MEARLWGCKVWVVFYVFLGHTTELENQIGATGHNVFYPTSAVGLVTLG